MRLAPRPRMMKRVVGFTGTGASSRRSSDWSSAVCCTRSSDRRKGAADQRPDVLPIRPLDARSAELHCNTQSKEPRYKARGYAGASISFSTVERHAANPKPASDAMSHDAAPRPLVKA